MHLHDARALGQTATEVVKPRRLRIRHVLVVHDDEAWTRGVAARLAEHEAELHGARSLHALDAALDARAFDAALFDVRALRSPDWYHALERLGTSSPAPVTVAWGEDLSAYDGFHLGRLGTRLLLPRRPSPDRVWMVLREAVNARPAFDPHVRGMVGHAALSDVVERVRRLYLDQGLGLEREDRSKTARLLGVTRQAVQQMIRRFADEEDAESPSGPKS